MKTEIVREFFVKFCSISNLIKTGLSVLELFHAYGRSDFIMRSAVFRTRLINITTTNHLETRIELTSETSYQKNNLSKKRVVSRFRKNCHRNHLINVTFDQNLSI
jgi:hypothetical protein